MVWGGNAAIIWATVSAGKRIYKSNKIWSSLLKIMKFNQGVNNLTSQIRHISIFLTTELQDDSVVH